MTNPEYLDEWLRRQGHSVFLIENSYWFNIAPRILQAIPYHLAINPSLEEINHLMVDSKALGLRYSAPIDSNKGAISYHTIFNGSTYSLPDLPKKARYDVRKGLDYFQIEPVSFERMALDGWQARKDTLIRQGREKAEDEAWWRRLCESAVGLDGFDAWVALFDDEIAASLIAFTCDGVCSILYQQSRSEYLSQGVNNALTFEFTRNAIEREDVKSIFYGLHSLDAPPGVDAFKFRMGYRAKPVRQRVVFHPALRPFFNRGSHSALRLARRLWPGSPFLAKGEGMLRFYLEGKKPLSQQTWPEGLKKKRERILREGSGQ